MSGAHVLIIPILASSLALQACTAVDGDTIRCSGVRYRLLAINAADDPKSQYCRRKHQAWCNGPMYLAGRAGMARALSGPVRFEITGYDRYRRPVGIARVGGTSLNCTMLAKGLASYEAKFDRQRLVAHECRIGTTEATRRTKATSASRAGDPK